MDIVNDENMLIRAMDYQIITAYTTNDNGTIYKHVDRALHHLIENIKMSEKLKVQCEMIGDFLYKDNNKKDEMMEDRIEYAINRRK